MTTRKSAVEVTAKQFEDLVQATPDPVIELTPLNAYLAVGRFLYMTRRVTA